MYLYPKWLRAWHWLNAIIFLVLIVTGISMQYTGKSSPSYLVGFSKAVRWHNVSAVILTVNYIIYLIANSVSGNWKYYRVTEKRFFRDVVIQLKYYSYGMFRGEKAPYPVTEERKFNPLQKLTYILVMYFALPMLIISGVGMFFPEITLKSLLGISGLIYTDVLHVTMGFLLSIFTLVHVYTCTLGARPFSLFMGMISGYHYDEH